MTVTGPEPDDDGDDGLPELDGDAGSTVTVPGGDTDASIGGGGLRVNVDGRTVTFPGDDPNEASGGKAVTVVGGRGGSNGVVPLP